MASPTDDDEVLAVGQGLEVFVCHQVQDDRYLRDLFHRLVGVFSSVVGHCHPQQLSWFEQRGWLYESVDGLQYPFDHRFGKDHLVFIAELGDEQMTQDVGQCLVSQRGEVSLTMDVFASHRSPPFSSAAGETSDWSGAAFASADVWNTARLSRSNVRAYSGTFNSS